MKYLTLKIQGDAYVTLEPIQNIIILNQLINKIVVTCMDTAVLCF